jgi:enoyl-CoA hydratase/carnithine racemase
MISEARYQDIRVDVDGRVAVVTLIRPETGNTVSGAGTVAELEHAVRGLDEAGEVSVLIVTGSGRFFSAGGDVKAMRDRAGMFAGTPHDVFTSYGRAVQRLTRLMAGAGLVTIAAVNGAALGAGCDLALMCDLRLAGRSATFGQAFVNLGLVPGDGGAWFLARAVPRHVAADLVFTGRTLSAAAALRLGLLNELVEDEQLLSRAREIAAGLAAKPPLAVRLGKRLLNHAYELALPEFLDQCAAFQALLHHSADHREALAAFFEKRPGNYAGQ